MMPPAGSRKTEEKRYEGEFEKRWSLGRGASSTKANRTRSLCEQASFFLRSATVPGRSNEGTLNGLDKQAARDLNSDVAAPGGRTSAWQAALQRNAGHRSTRSRDRREEIAR